MLTRARNHLSHNLIAYLALFIALGGTSYAAVRINGKNIKNRSIPAKKVKRNALRGAEINESKLGQVPLAAQARLGRAVGRVDYNSKSVAIDPGEVKKGTVGCDSGLRAIGGGIRLGNPFEQTMIDSYPAGKTAWEGNVAHSLAGVPDKFTVYVICTRVATTG
jgi:hypothetical protein